MQKEYKMRLTQAFSSYMLDDIFKSKHYFEVLQHERKSSFNGFFFFSIIFALSLFFCDVIKTETWKGLLFITMSLIAIVSFIGLIRSLYKAMIVCYSISEYKNKSKKYIDTIYEFFGYHSYSLSQINLNENEFEKYKEILNKIKNKLGDEVFSIYMEATRNYTSSNINNLAFLNILFHIIKRDIDTMDDVKLKI